MSDGASRADRGEQTADEDALHVFDQTNGVLGPDSDGDDRKREADSTPPASIGVPPIVSL